MRGGRGPCPNFLSTFHKLYILGQFGDGEGGGDPCPNFLAHWRLKKVVKVVQIRGRGGPCPNFLSTFHKLYILGQFRDGEGGGDPWPNFWHIGVKKSGTSCPNYGGARGSR